MRQEIHRILQARASRGVASDDDSFKADTMFVIIGAVVIFLASLCLAVLIYSNARRTAQVNQVRTAAAKRLAITERELNDWVAHEVCFQLGLKLAHNFFLGPQSTQCSYECLFFCVCSIT